MPGGQGEKIWRLACAQPAYNLVVNKLRAREVPLEGKMTLEFLAFYLICTVCKGA